MEVIKIDCGHVRVSTQEQNTQRQLIADTVLQLLSYVTQTEREFIHQRQAEGIAAAKARGIKFGRKPMNRPSQFPTMKAKWQAGKLSARAAANQLDVPHSTFLRWTREERWLEKYTL